MRIFLLSCALLLAASPAFAGPDSSPGVRSASSAPAKKLAQKPTKNRKAGARVARPALSTPKTSWPKALKHRVSRYARFERVMDREGDFREKIRFAMVRTRLKDVRGDRLELARAKLSKRHRFASRNAVLARKRGTESDLRERQLSQLTRVRSRADFRRQMVIPADEMAELAKYKKGLQRFGNPLASDRLRMADKRSNQRGVDASARSNNRRRRGERTDEDNPYRDRYLHQREGDEGDRRDEADAGEEKEDRDSDRHSDRDSDRDTDRDTDREDRDAEKEDADEEKDADRDAEKEEADEEKDAERDAEKDEREGERAADRADEKTIRQAEENTSDE
jgi:hypothetical protein